MNKAIEALRLNREYHILLEKHAEELASLGHGPDGVVVFHREDLDAALEKAFIATKAALGSEPEVNLQLFLGAPDLLAAAKNALLFIDDQAAYLELENAIKNAEGE